MNKLTRAVSDEEFERILLLLKTGYVSIDEETGKMRRHMPNQKASFAWFLEGVLGLRISDVCRLTLADNFIKENNGWHLIIKEKKTGKLKKIFCPIYDEIVTFCLNNNIGRKERIIKCTPRNIQEHLMNAAKFLNLDFIGTHSARKRFSSKIYDTSKDINLVSSILMHSSVAITQRYLRISSEAQREALQFASTIKF